MFHGFRDLSPGGVLAQDAAALRIHELGDAFDFGAPVPMRVLFPSIGGTPQLNEILWPCGEYPLVVLAHGQCFKQGVPDAQRSHWLACGRSRIPYGWRALGTWWWCRSSAASGPARTPTSTSFARIAWIRTQFEPGDWGWTASIPGFGLLADDFTKATLRITRPEGGLAEFLPGMRISPAPCCGALGVAPAGEPRSTIPLTELGGDMDTRHLVSASTSSCR